MCELVTKFNLDFVSLASGSSSGSQTVDDHPKSMTSSLSASLREGWATVAGRAIHQPDQFWVTGNFAPHSPTSCMGNRGKMRRHANVSANGGKTLEQSVSFFRKCTAPITCVDFAAWERAWSIKDC
jgi:hypothetical protein